MFQELKKACCLSGVYCDVTVIWPISEDAVDLYTRCTIRHRTPNKKPGVKKKRENSKKQGSKKQGDKKQDNKEQGGKKQRDTKQRNKKGRLNLRGKQ